MTKKIDVARELKERSNGLIPSIKVANTFLTILGEMTVDHIADEDGFSPIPGVKLGVVKRAARNGVNPSTGEALYIEERYAPKAKFGKSIKDAVKAIEL